jgi:hypothetical protein
MASHVITHVNNLCITKGTHCDALSFGHHELAAGLDRNDNRSSWITVLLIDRMHGERNKTLTVWKLIRE